MYVVEGGVNYKGRGGLQGGQRVWGGGIARCVGASKRVCVHVRVDGCIGGWVGCARGGEDTQTCFEQYLLAGVFLCEGV